MHPPLLTSYLFDCVGKSCNHYLENMGMTADQTAAIMGAHTLGNMEKENSGYSGPWLTDPAGELNHKTSFDNQYYQFMLNSDYTYTGKVSNLYISFSTSVV